jgi:hypothetical protein
MTNDTFTTNFWSWDGSGSNWVEYPKGFNSDGKDIVNGLSSKAGHAYTVAEGFWDATGTDVDLVLSGNWAKNATKKALKAAFAGEVFTYVENFTTDVGDINVCGPKGSKAYPWVLDTCPKKEWDAAAAAEALACQVKTFGEFFSFGIKNAKASKKYEMKMAALKKSLDSAFGPETTYGEGAYLDTCMDKEPDWYPTSADPIEAMIEEESKEEEMAALVAKAKAALSVDDWEMVKAAAEGKTKKEIAEMKGVSGAAVTLKWKTIYKKVSKATGMAFVAC